MAMAVGTFPERLSGFCIIHLIAKPRVPRAQEVICTMYTSERAMLTVTATRIFLCLVIGD